MVTKKRKASRRTIKKSPFFRLFCLVVLLCASMAATVFLIFLRPGTLTQNEEQSPPFSAKVKQEKIIPPAPPQKKDTSAPRQKVAAMEPEGPRIALIIDDIGAQRKIGESFMNLDLDLSFSILPHSPHGLELAQKAQSKGRDVLLHLPMEPIDLKWDPGPGALFLKMNKHAMQDTLIKDLAAVPMATGINNHMGSRYSENTAAMRAFLSEIKPKNLFFIDSLTSSKSVGYKIAKEMGVKTAKRDVFLDNEKDPEKILKQIEKLVEIAQKNGSAIGIGHPYPSTLEALSTALPLLQKEVLVTAVHNLLE